MIADGDPATSPWVLEEEDVAEILYTSGTTGMSKGVVLTHKNLVHNLFQGPDVLGFINETSTVLSLLPMAHAFGSTSAFLSIIYCGSLIRFMTKKPTPKILEAVFADVKPNIVGGVPLIFEKIYRKQVLPALEEKAMTRALRKFPPARKLLHKIAGKKILKFFGGNLDCVIIGGAALNDEVEQFLRDASIPFAMGYGMSECAPLISFAHPRKLRAGSCGKVIPGMEARIIDADEAGTGEIQVRGQSVMRGYWNNEEETRKVFTEDGWLITGDRGFLDKAGYLHIRGRTKNVIIGPSGENIYPESIEGKLNESTRVEESLVYLVDGKLTARVQLAEAYEETKALEVLETLRKETNERLSGSSRILNMIWQKEPFIKTPTNKIRRKLYIPNY
jgi:long-chain acyl-CoA synthetase